MYKFGLGEYTRASFGGGIFEGFNGAEIYNDNGDVFSKFGNGEYTILIGTSHLYEGVDVPNLDVIVLACGGKGERTQVQGIGRALRKTKSGKYAYIVDFTDTEDAILSRHSRMRMNRYVDIIGVPNEHIYKGISVDNLEEIFNMVTHIVGAAIGVVAIVLCVIMAAIHHNVYGVISGAIFGTTMVTLYTMSSIYHGLNPELKGKKVKFDVKVNEIKERVLPELNKEF